MLGRAEKPAFLTNQALFVKPIRMVPLSLKKAPKIKADGTGSRNLQVRLITFSEICFVFLPGRALRQRGNDLGPVGFTHLSPSFFVPVICLVYLVIQKTCPPCFVASSLLRYYRWFVILGSLLIEVRSLLFGPVSRQSSGSAESSLGNGRRLKRFFLPRPIFTSGSFLLPVFSVIQSATFFSAMPK